MSASLCWSTCGLGRLCASILVLCCLKGFCIRARSLLLNGSALYSPVAHRISSRMIASNKATAISILHHNTAEQGPSLTRSGSVQDRSWSKTRVQTLKKLAEFRLALCRRVLGRDLLSGEINFAFCNVLHRMFHQPNSLDTVDAHRGKIQSIVHGYSTTLAVAVAVGGKFHAHLYIVSVAPPVLHYSCDCGCGQDMTKPLDMAVFSPGAATLLHGGARP